MSNNQTTLAKWFHKNGYEPIAPLDFYRAIFPAGELATYTDKPRALENNTEWKYNAILLENTHERKPCMKTNPRTGKKEHTEKEVWKNHIVLDDLSQIEEAVAQFGSTKSDFFIAPIVQCEIGALVIGGIFNERENARFCKGTEKGHFELSGSTIVLLFEPGQIQLKHDLLEKLAMHEEVRVSQGQWIGIAERRSQNEA